MIRVEPGLPGEAPIRGPQVVEEGVGFVCPYPTFSSSVTHPVRSAHGICAPAPIAHGIRAPVRMPGARAEAFARAHGKRTLRIKFLRRPTNLPRPAPTLLTHVNFLC